MITIKTRLTLGLCIFTILSAAPQGAPQAEASARDCISEPCIDVLTSPITGEIIGRGTSVRPGSAARHAKVRRRPVVKKKRTRVAKRVVNPICTIDQLVTFTCIKTPNLPVVSPVVSHVAVTPAKPTVISTDEVRRALPHAQLGFQPGAGAVVNVPVIFWSGLATPARFSLTLLGQSVDVNMNAHFLWAWGDGTSLATTSVGAPFPNRSLTHTYVRPGRYQVAVVTTWSGSASVGQASIQIVGAPIETVDQREVVVSQAPTNLTPIQ